MGLRIDASAYNLIGRRSNNEDSFYVNGLYMQREQMDEGGKYHELFSNPQQIYAVCDGMGGVEFGEEASFRAVSELKEYQDKSSQADNTENLNGFITSLSENVDSISRDRNLPSGSCGSTIAMLILRDWFYRTVHVGDSRIYLLRDGVLTRLTRDDSEVQNLVDAGRITQEEAFDHPRKNVITRHLGMPTGDSPLRPAISDREELKEGDRFLICSDGLSDALRDSAIQELLSSEQTSEGTAKRLAQSALTAMDEAEIASDNITVIVLDVKGVGDRNADKRRVRRWRLIRALTALLGLGTLAGFVVSAAQMTHLLMR